MTVLRLVGLEETSHPSRWNSTKVATPSCEWLKDQAHAPRGQGVEEQTDGQKDTRQRRMETWLPGKPH